MLDLRLVVDSMGSAGEPVTVMLARLRHRIQPVVERQGMQLDWDVELPPGIELQSDGTPHLVAIVQDALSSALQHAKATRLAIKVRYLTQSDSWQADVTDDGIGLHLGESPFGTGGRGLLGMQKRAELAGGELRIVNLPNGGTSLSASVPCNGAASCCHRSMEILG